MKIKAKISFCGGLTMAKGEEKEIKNNKIVDDLIEAGYVEVIEEKNQNEDKRGKAKSD